MGFPDQYCTMHSLQFALLHPTTLLQSKVAAMASCGSAPGLVINATWKNWPFRVPFPGLSSPYGAFMIAAPFGVNGHTQFGKLP